MLADYARRHMPLGHPLGSVESFDHPVLHHSAAFIFPAVLIAFSVPDLRRGVRPVGEARALVFAAAAGSFVSAGVLYFTFRDVPRLMVVYFLFIEVGLLAWVRLVAGLGLVRRGRRGRPFTLGLLVRAGDAAERVTEALTGQTRNAVKIVGCAEECAQRGPKRLPVVGGVAEVPRRAAQLQVDEAIVALPLERYRDADRVAFNLNCSIWQDLEILWRTVGKNSAGRGRSERIISLKLPKTKFQRVVFRRYASGRLVDWSTPPEEK